MEKDWLIPGWESQPVPCSPLTSPNVWDNSSATFPAMTLPVAASTVRAVFFSETYSHYHCADLRINQETPGDSF